VTKLAAARRLLSRCARGVTGLAARAYVAGDTLSEAVHVAEHWTDRGMGVTLGYWSSPDDSPRRVADEYLAEIPVLSTLEHGYLSVKLPAIDFSHELFAQIVERAALHNVPVHIDSLEPQQVDRARNMVDKFLDEGANLSFTLLGNWARSVDDARWAAQRGITVRVVKGQWIDRCNSNHDLCAGYLNVIDRLAGTAKHVAVATHDDTLIVDAVERLRAAGTTCHLELLYGLPMRQAIAIADRLELGIFVYVPYGKSYLPYAVSRVQGDPKIVWWLLRDLFSSWRPYQVARDKRRELVESEA
jgi:proline dehydrogenase